MSGQSRQRRKVLLIGWDAADWKLISPLIDAGKMPTLRRLVEQGAMGGLSSLSPLISAMLWTSIATGKRADRHGILSSTKPDVHLGAVRPVGVESRTTTPIWNILSRNGIKTHVVNWYATHPAESLNGVLVSDRFAEPAIPPGAVFPTDLESTFASLRVHPGDLSAEHILPFIPQLGKIDQDVDRRPVAAAAILAESATVHAAATWIMEHEQWEFLAVHYRGLEQWGQTFGRYAPPIMAGIVPRDVELYGQVALAGYRFYDMMLARLLALAGEDATIMLVSDHGTCVGDSRPRSASAGMRWHRGRGIFCLRGPGIRTDELVHGAGILDIVPTILTLFGLPLASDMEGRPMLSAWEQPPALTWVPTWENDGAVETSAESACENQAEIDAALSELQQQGYADTLAAILPALRKAADNADQFHLAMVHLTAGRPEKALPILEQLHQRAPGHDSTALFMGYCHFLLRDYQQCRAMVSTMRKNSVDEPLGQLLLGMTSLAEDRPVEALDRLSAARATHRREPQIVCFIGQAYLQLGRHEEAQTEFTRSLAMDPDLVAAHIGRARSFAQQRRWQDCAEAALAAVGVNHHQPEAHFLLGAALAQLGYGRRAIVAFENAISQRPGYTAAHEWLGKIHQQVTGNAERAAHHQALAQTGRQYQAAP